MSTSKAVNRKGAIPTTPRSNEMRASIDHVLSGNYTRDSRLQLRASLGLEEYAGAAQQFIEVLLRSFIFALGVCQPVQVGGALHIVLRFVAIAGEMLLGFFQLVV